MYTYFHIAIRSRQPIDRFRKVSALRKFFFREDAIFVRILSPLVGVMQSVDDGDDDGGVGIHLLQRIHLKVRQRMS